MQFFECEEKSANHKSFSESLTKEYDKERAAVLRSRQLEEDMMVEMVSNVTGWGQLTTRTEENNKFTKVYHSDIDTKLESIARC